MNEKCSSEFIRKAEEFKKSMGDIIKSGDGRAVLIVLLENETTDGTYSATVSGVATDHDLAMCIQALFEDEKIKEMIIEEAKSREIK
jgi:hypothetical protein